jgi:hypothetical protein
VDKQFNKIMRNIIVIAVLAITLGCTKQASDQPATRKAKGHPQIESSLSSMVLTNNGGGSFSIDYGGATDVVWMFFRWGDSLSTSGNVIPVSTQSFYLNPVTTFQAWGVGTYYQAVIITGSTQPVNGVVGADWVTTYSNVVQ